MTFPSSDVGRTNADAGTDVPATYRADALDLIDKFNLLRNHFSTFMAGAINSITDAATGRAALGAAASGANSDITSLGAVTAINGGQISAFRNKLHNPAALVKQRPTPATYLPVGRSFTTIDRWASIITNFTSLAGLDLATSTGMQAYGFDCDVAMVLGGSSGSAANSGGGTWAFSQRLEAKDVQQLAGKTVTLSGKFRAINGVTSQTAYVQILKATGGVDNFSTTSVLATTSGSPTTITHNTNGVEIKVSVALSAADVVNGIEVQFVYVPTGNLSSGLYFYVGDVQLEVGSVVTRHEQRPYATELAICQRYCYRFSPPQVYSHMATLQAAATSGAFGVALSFPEELRAVPTVTYSAAGHFIVSTAAGAGIPITAITANAHSCRCAGFNISVASGLVAGAATVLQTANILAWVLADAEL